MILQLIIGSLLPAAVIATAYSYSIGWLILLITIWVWAIAGNQILVIINLKKVVFENCLQIAQIGGDYIPKRTYLFIALTPLITICAFIWAQQPGFALVFVALLLVRWYKFSCIAKLLPEVAEEYAKVAKIESAKMMQRLVDEIKSKEAQEEQ